MILVSGATGNVGGELVRTLVETGQPVRALSRTPRPTGLPAGVEAAVGDLNQPDTLKDALEGVTGVFLLPGYADMERLLSVVKDAGVQRAVLLSGSSAASGDMTNAITAYMARSEEAVRASGLPSTVIRPNEFMSNALRWAPQLAAGDIVHAPFAEIRSAVLDPADIAAVAALSLTTSGHEGKTYRISGPQALTPGERVEILARVLGRDLRFSPQSNDEVRIEMTATMPSDYVAAFFNFYVDGALDESEVLPTVEELIGRPPTNFEEWARAHSQAFNSD